jgi:WD40 repeat protein
LGEATNRVVISSDRRLLASGDKAGFVCVYRTDTGRVLHRLEVSGQVLRPLAFSHDGCHLATMDEKSGVLRLWQTASGKVTQTLSAWDGGKQILSTWELRTGKLVRKETLPQGPISDYQFSYFRAAFLPSERKLATWDGKQILRTWDLRTGKLVRKDRCPTVDRLTSFSPNGRFFCTLAAHNCLALFDLQTGRWRRIYLRTSTYHSLCRWAWSIDDRGLAIYTAEPHQITVYETATGRQSCCLRVEGTPPPGISIRGEDGLLMGALREGGMTFGPNGRTIALERENCVEVRDLSSPARRTVLDTGHDSFQVWGVGNLFYRDDRHLIVVDPFGFIRLFDARTGKVVRGAGHRSEVTGLAFTADGKTLVSLGEDATLRSWDTRTGRSRQSLVIPEEVAGGSVSLSGDGRWAALMGQRDKSQAIVVVDLARGREAWRDPEADRGDRNALSFLDPPCQVSRDGSVVSIPRDIENGDKVTPHLELREASTGRLLQSFTVASIGVSTLSPDGRSVALALPGKNGYEVGLLATDAPGVVRRLPVKTTDTSVQLMVIAFSPDGRVLAGADLRHAYLWEKASGQLLERVALPVELAPSRLVITAAGHVLFAGVRGARQTLTGKDFPWDVWDLHTRRIVRTTARTAPVIPAALSADGRTLALAQQDSSILLYDVPLPVAKRVPLGEEDRSRLWADLASSDAHCAWRARRRLAAAGQDSVTLLARHLVPATRTVPATLLADLDADDFTTRQAARSKLAQALQRGDVNVEMSLRQLLHSKPSLEVYRSVQRLLRRHAVRPVKYSPAELRHIRAVAVLEDVGSKEAVTLLKKLAAGQPAVLTREARAALDRLRGG